MESMEEIDYISRHSHHCVLFRISCVVRASVRDRCFACSKYWNITVKRSKKSFRVIDSLFHRMSWRMITEALSAPIQQNLSFEGFSNSFSLKIYLSGFNINVFAQFALPTKIIFLICLVHLQDCYAYLKRKPVGIWCSNAKLRQHIPATTSCSLERSHLLKHFKLLWYVICFLEATCLVLAS